MKFVLQWNPANAYTIGTTAAFLEYRGIRISVGFVYFSRYGNSYLCCWVVWRCIQELFLAVCWWEASICIMSNFTTVQVLRDWKTCLLYRIVCTNIRKCIWDQMKCCKCLHKCRWLLFRGIWEGCPKGRVPMQTLGNVCTLFVDRKYVRIKFYLNPSGS